MSFNCVNLRFSCGLKIYSKHKTFPILKKNIFISIKISIEIFIIQKKLSNYTKKFHLIALHVKRKNVFF
jgi:hypothetical protein